MWPQSGPPQTSRLSTAPQRSRPIGAKHQLASPIDRFARATQLQPQLVALYAPPPTMEACVVLEAWAQHSQKPREHCSLAGRAGGSYGGASTAHDEKPAGHEAVSATGDVG